MKNIIFGKIKILARLITFFCIYSICISSLIAQEIEQAKQQKNAARKIFSPSHRVELGDILYSFSCGTEPLGVTVVNNKVIISDGGASSTVSTDNVFNVYDFNGTLENTYSQGSTSRRYSF